MRSGGQREASGEFMRRTLFLIPHDFLGIPVFGVGWVLLLTIILLVIRCLLVRRHSQSTPGGRIAGLLRTEGWIWAGFTAAIIFVLPRVELTNIHGDPVGMAIRGYGVMLLMGVASAVALSAYRAQRRGINPDIIFGIAPWAFFGGILGARLFYVVQYRDEFIGASLGETIGNMLRFTEGGLVVYGAFIGGVAAGTYFIVRHRLNWLQLGDVIVPCMFIGLAFGRIGCLMNGCCYGGRCDEGNLALHFPPSSPVYQKQIRSGELLGFHFDPTTHAIQQVEPGSLAEEAGIQVGSRLEMMADDLTPLEAASPAIPKEDALAGVIAEIDGRRFRWGPDRLPARALPVYPAQLLSSVSALLLCLGLCWMSSWSLREGTVTMVGFACYAMIRFGLEIVRQDEAGQFGTVLSISQWVSLAVLVGSIIGLGWLYLAPRSTNMQTPVTSGN